MANNKDSESEENNDNPTSGNNVTEGLSAEEAAKVDYDEAEVWKKSQKPLYIILGTIFFIIGGYYYYDNSQISEQSERSYRFLSANIDSEGAEKRFLSFAKDYDDKLGGVAFYRAAIIQYKDKRYAEAAKNFSLAVDELGQDPLAGRALIGQAVSLIKENPTKAGLGIAILEKLASGKSYLPADRNEAHYLLAVQALTENDMENLSTHKNELAKDLNASYFLSRLDELVKTKKFLDIAKSLPEINLLNGKSFLDQNSKRESVKSLESGLQYEVIESGAGESPDENDTVEVHYTGTLINGEVFDSSVDRNETTTFAVNGVIKGWTEALLLMTVGDKWKLFIPSELAYGETGNNSIGPNETLIFDVELINIVPKETPEIPSDINSSTSDASVDISDLDLNTSKSVLDENVSKPSDDNKSE